ncbi:type II/III secretion system family protein, partial [Burkholderia pseudomallei 354e]
EPAARAQAAARAHPPAAALPSPSAGLGLRAQTRLLGN